MNSFYLATGSALIAGFLTVLATSTGDTRRSRRSRLDDAVSRLSRHYTNLRFDIELHESQRFVGETIDMREISHALAASLANSDRGRRLPSWIGMQRPAHGLHEVLAALDLDMKRALSDRRQVKDVANLCIEATLEWEASPATFRRPARTLEGLRQQGREDRQVRRESVHRI